MSLPVLRPYFGPRHHLGPFPKRRKKNLVCGRGHARIPENMDANGQCVPCKKMGHERRKARKLLLEPKP